MADTFAKPVLETLKEQVTRRRALLIAPLAFAGLVAISSRRGDSSSERDADPYVEIVQFDDAGRRHGLARVKRIVRSDAEWRKMLSAEQFYVTRRENTDTPYTGTFYKMHEAGLYRCICCGNALFSSDTKFDSGTGWPSFWAPVADENIRIRKDTSMFLDRVEVRCKLCDAHQGHVFDDGPGHACLSKKPNHQPRMNASERE
jgi:peptide-methionine (R)-S-oxide reductase